VRILRLLVAIVLGLVFGLAMVAIISTQVFGYRLAAIASESMRPAPAPGDLIVTRPVPITDIETDDIVLFETGTVTKILVAHRVANVVTLNVNITDSETGEKRTEQTKILRTKGDANEATDEQPVDATSYRGLLWLTIPGAGNVLASPLPFIVLAAVIGVIWLLLEVVGYVRRSRRTAPTDEAGST
jgi:signal peptidase I